MYSVLHQVGSVVFLRFSKLQRLWGLLHLEDKKQFAAGNYSKHTTHIAIDLMMHPVTCGTPTSQSWIVVLLKNFFLFPKVLNDFLDWIRAAGMGYHEHDDASTCPQWKGLAGGSSRRWEQEGRRPRWKVGGAGQGNKEGSIEYQKGSSVHRDLYQNRW